MANKVIWTGIPEGLSKPHRIVEIELIDGDFDYVLEYASAIDALGQPAWLPVSLDALAQKIFTLWVDALKGQQVLEVDKVELQAQLAAAAVKP